MVSHLNFSNLLAGKGSRGTQLNNTRKKLFIKTLQQYVKKPFSRLLSGFRASIISCSPSFNHPGHNKIWCKAKKYIWRSLVNDPHPWNKFTLRNFQKGCEQNIFSVLYWSLLLLNFSDFENKINVASMPD